MVLAIRLARYGCLPRLRFYDILLTVLACFGITKKSMQAPGQWLAQTA